MGSSESSSTVPTTLSGPNLTKNSHVSKDESQNTISLIHFTKSQKILEDNLHNLKQQHKEKEEKEKQKQNRKIEEEKNISLNAFYECVRSINYQVAQNKESELKVKCDFLYPLGAERMKTHLKESGYVNSEIYWGSKQFCSACYGCYDKLYSIIEIKF